MHPYVHMHVCACTCPCVHLHMHASMHVHADTWARTCAHMHMHTHMQVDNSAVTCTRLYLDQRSKYWHVQLTSLSSPMLTPTSMWGWIIDPKGQYPPTHICCDQHNHHVMIDTWCLMLDQRSNIDINGSIIDMIATWWYDDRTYSWCLISTLWVDIWHQELFHHHIKPKDSGSLTINPKGW